MTKSHVLFSFSGVLLFGVLSLFQAKAPPVQLDATVQVPIGGIIMWWGLAADIPEGFEACDGTIVTTKNAVLRGAKPNLESKFPRGAARYRNFVPQAFTGGGQDEIKIEDHVLTAEQLPSHTHALNPLEHKIKRTPPGATLPPNSLTHFHDVGVNNGGAFEQISLVSDTASTDKGVLYTTTGTKVTTPGPDLLTSLRVSTIEDHTGITTLPTGRGAPITHRGAGGATLDNRPAFVDVVFLIRVK